jgi:hypothetical protein
MHASQSCQFLLQKEKLGLVNPWQPEASACVLGAASVDEIALDLGFCRAVVHHTDQPVGADVVLV